MNRNKGGLYKAWQEEDPQFLPMKFRPKIQKNDNPQITDLRLQEAFEKYKRNTKELKIFEENHEKPFRDVDREITTMIHEITGTTEQQGLLTERLNEMWYSETSDQEYRSLEIWNKKERFLIRKKYEEIKNGDIIKINYQHDE